MQAETIIDLRYNVAALYIAILSEKAKTPEQAFAVISGTKYRLTDEDTLDMMNLKESGVTYKEIAKMYGFSDSYIARRVRKHRKKTSLDGSPKRSVIKKHY